MLIFYYIIPVAAWDRNSSFITVRASCCSSPMYVRWNERTTSWSDYQAQRHVVCDRLLLGQGQGHRIARQSSRASAVSAAHRQLVLSLRIYVVHHQEVLKTSFPVAYQSRLVHWFVVLYLSLSSFLSILSYVMFFMCRFWLCYFEQLPCKACISSLTCFLNFT